jgi:hypothetical protein
LLKDTVLATGDARHTTAGSLALADAKPPSPDDGAARDVLKRQKLKDPPDRTRFWQNEPNFI